MSLSWKPGAMAKQGTRLSTVRYIHHRLATGNNILRSYLLLSFRNEKYCIRVTRFRKLICLLYNSANMRELKKTGFMSNRGRQNVASFLVRDLGQDWRYGAEHFESLLLDHDVCSNYGTAFLAFVLLLLPHVYLTNAY
jgi:hypothetical protein